MVGWRTAGAGRMEDGKERDLNQSSSKMDGARRGREKRRREGGRERGFNRGGDVEKDAGRGEEKVVLAGAVKGKWVEVQALGSPPRPACSTSCISGAVIGLGTVRCPAAVCPMSPVKRGCIWGRGKAVGPSARWVQPG